MATQSIDREPIPAWLTPAEGFRAEEFLALPDLPRHTELIDGGLVFVAPQRNFHMAMIDLLVSAIRRQLPDGLRVGREMALRLGDRTVVEPDVMIIAADRPADPDRTHVLPDETVLVVEVSSPDSVERDRDTKPHKYAQAGIEHYWRVEQTGQRAVVHCYRLDPASGSYLIAGVHHDRLDVTAPAQIRIDLGDVEQFYL